VKLAQQIGARVSVLYVAAELRPSDLAGADGLNLEDEQRRILQEAETDLRAFVSEHLADVATSSRIVRGDVAEQVAAAAADIDADYVVVGTHGRGGLARLVLGDTTHAILQHTTRSVLVVPMQSGVPAAD
jgi:nucleotide-binding universal stress UspA family protein